MEVEKTRAQILGANLERIRKEKGFSRKQLAAAIGITEIAYGAYERGERNLPADKIFNLAVSLNVKVADILGENPNAENSEVFQYRLQRAYKMASDFLDRMLNDEDEPRFDKEGHIVICSPVKMKIKYENGSISITHYGGYNLIAFKDKQDFVKVMEQAEWDALQKNISFNAALREIVFNEKPE